MKIQVSSFYPNEEDARNHEVISPQLASERKMKILFAFLSSDANASGVAALHRQVKRK